MFQYAEYLRTGKHSAVLATVEVAPPPEPEAASDAEAESSDEDGADPTHNAAREWLSAERRQDIEAALRAFVGAAIRDGTLFAGKPQKEASAHGKEVALRIMMLQCPQRHFLLIHEGSGRTSLQLDPVCLSVSATPSTGAPAEPATKQPTLDAVVAQQRAPTPTTAKHAAEEGQAARPERKRRREAPPATLTEDDYLADVVEIVDDEDEGDGGGAGAGAPARTHAELCAAAQSLPGVPVDRITAMVAGFSDQLKQIFAGKLFSQRHQEYREKGKARDHLKYRLRFGTLTMAQQGAVVGELSRGVTRGKSKYSHYLMDVLVTEANIRIYMRHLRCDYPTAESVLNATS